MKGLGSVPRTTTRTVAGTRGFWRVQRQKFGESLSNARPTECLRATQPDSVVLRHGCPSQLGPILHGAREDAMKDCGSGVCLFHAWCLSSPSDKSTPDKFECIGRRRSAWCKKAELSGR